APLQPESDERSPEHADHADGSNEGRRHAPYLTSNVTILTSRKCTVHETLATSVIAVTSTAPKTGSLAPGPRTTTAACASKLSHLLSCGWYSVYFPPSISRSLGHGSGVT